jgi:hypothetical protein
MSRKSRKRILIFILRKIIYVLRNYLRITFRITFLEFRITFLTNQLPGHVYLPVIGCFMITGPLNTLIETSLYEFDDLVSKFRGSYCTDMKN